MSFLGEYDPGALVTCKFVTHDSTGAPTALSGGTVSVYKNSSTTQTTTGVTLTTSFDSVTGMNHVAIDTSADSSFYAADSTFQVIVTAGTVGGTSVVGYPVGAFKIGCSPAQAALRAQCGNAKRVWVASSTGSDSNDGLTPLTPKTLKGCIAAATRGDAIYALPESSAQRLDYYWNGSSNTQSDGYGNINLSAGVSFYGNGNTYYSFRALSADNNSQTSRGLILVTGPGSVIQDVTIWPRASELGVICAYTRSGTTATVTHNDHGFASGMTVTVSGSAPNNIDGDYSITVTGTDTYTITTAGSSSTPGLGTFRYADNDIYQGSFGNSNANDATFSPTVTLRRCKSRGSYASDVAYWDVSSSTLRQFITIEDCDFVAGWDCLYLSSSVQTANIRNTRMETLGQAPVDATYSRVVRQGNAIAVYDNCQLIYAGGSTTKRAIDVGGGTVILQRGTTITRSGDTEGSDVYASSASTIVVAGAGVDVSRISNSGGTTIHGQLLPTVAGRTLDVTSTGAAGVDWGNVENKTTTNALTNTTIDVESSSGALTASDVWAYSTRSLTSGIVTVAAPYQTGQQTIYRGMSYVNANSNAKTFTKGDAFNWPSDLASLPWTVTLYIEPSAALLTTNSSAASLSKAGTVASATSVRFDLTSSNTDDLTVTTNKGKYLYTVVATTGSHKWVLESGVLEVVDDLATA